MQPQAAFLSLKAGTSSDSETPNAEIKMPGQYEPKEKQTVLPVSTPEPAASQVQSRRASYKAQAGALFRKNAVYQRRNWCSNACLLSAPIFFCLLLFGIQLAINKLLLSGEDYECGCKCTKCCFNSNPDNCTSVAYGFCPYDCLAKDKNTCGIQYSTPRQSYFCSIPHSSVWPALAQIPSADDRAEPYKPKLNMYYTGKDPKASTSMAAALLPKPNVTTSTLSALQKYQRSLLANFGSDSVTAPGELLSMLGLTLGTSADMGAAGLYLETGLTGEGQLDALWPLGTCDSLGLGSKKNISLDTMLGAMINASNPATTARFLNSALKNAFNGGGSISTAISPTADDGSSIDDGASLSAAGGSSQAALSQVGSIQMNCSDVVVKDAGSVDALERLLYCGFRQARCLGQSTTNQYAAAYDFKDSGKKGFTANIYYNDTFGIPKGASPTVYQRIPQNINLAINAWLSSVTGGRFSTQLLGVQETPKQASSVSLDFSSLLGPLFFTWVLQMLLPVFLMQLVYEKEKRLRMMMKMHGLGDSAYWLVTYGWFLALYCVYVFIFMLFGSLIGLNMFRKNSYGIQILLYFIFGNNMIASSFLLSCFFTNAKTATVFAYLIVFGSGIIGSLLLGTLIESGEWYVILLQLNPAFSLYRGLYEFGSYAFIAVYKNSYGMTIADLKDPTNGMVGAYIILLVEWVWFLLLAWYLEQVFASGTGNRKHPLYFLDYFRKEERNRSSSWGGQNHVMSVSEEPPDVAAEHARVAGLEDYVENPIVIRDLRKVYPGQDGQPPKLAVQTLNLGVERGECFGLLGPNGAGKSTSINMMVGLIEPSEGTAIIGGNNITRDMDAIYTLMGVCPQHDLLWDTLTGREHLQFYGRLKGLSGEELQSAVEEALRGVNLWNGKVADKQSRQYSGGMKRRLSVAISFIGSPLVVYLDEPSTGLDPASRRNLWDVVKSNKRDRAIVLTTHSMEEAEQLCDRLGIFVDGQLVCIGNPKEITSRYGDYLVFTITVPATHEDAAHALVLEMSPSAQLTYSVGGTLKFELPISEVSLSQVFKAMATARTKLQVLDWGVANATLEEVFIKFARQIGAEAGD